MGCCAMGAVALLGYGFWAVRENKVGASSAISASPTFIARSSRR